MTASEPPEHRWRTSSRLRTNCHQCIRHQIPARRRNFCWRCDSRAEQARLFAQNNNTDSSEVTRDKSGSLFASCGQRFDQLREEVPSVFQSDCQRLTRAHGMVCADSHMNDNAQRNRTNRMMQQKAGRHAFAWRAWVAFCPWHLRRGANKFMTQSTFRNSGR